MTRNFSMEKTVMPKECQAKNSLGVKSKELKSIKFHWIKWPLVEKSRLCYLISGWRWDGVQGMNYRGS